MQSAQCHALIDPPTHWVRVSDVESTQRDPVFASPNVVTYFPALTELSPEGQPVSALGAIAGMLSTPDFLKSSADIPLLRSRARVALEPDADEAAALSRRGVNVLRAAAPGFIAFTGNVTLAGGQGARREWQQLRIRRRVMMTAGTIARNTRWAAVQTSEPETWSAVAAQVGRYLTDATAGGFLGQDNLSRAFYVKCDQDTNPPGSRLSFVVGFELTRSRDFAAFRFDHDEKDCRVTEITWQPGPELATQI